MAGSLKLHDYLRLLFGVVLRLGLRNVCYIALYRATLRTGIRRLLFPMGESWQGSFFDNRPVEPPPDLDASWVVAILDEVEKLHNGRLRYFARHEFDVGMPPGWFSNPFNGESLPDPSRHWTRLHEFGQKFGDIKAIWEPSRFDWTLKLARAYRLTGESRHLELLNRCLADWTAQNPLNTGPNWRCGQEAAIRLVHLLLSAYLLGQFAKPTSAVVRFVAEHCQRISTNIRYALSQDNNHGTSEAAALFLGGSWLLGITEDRALTRRARRWSAKGRYWLENRIGHLVSDDGSFSQHSLTYHRLLLDTLNVVKFFQRTMTLPAFSERFHRRVIAAVNWLFQLVDPQSGDAPNLGGNDGTLLASLSSCQYRDFRPSVQLASLLFCGGRAYGAGPWDEPFHWLGLKADATHAPSPVFNRASRVFPTGGYVLIRRPESWALIRASSVRFRPAHADALHVDLWYRGQNILRDSGSYSYSCEETTYGYFSGTASHNTVECDQRDQMPRLQRFLFGAWVKVQELEQLGVEDGGSAWEGAYSDYGGCRHQRRIEAANGQWKIIDTVSGFRDQATLRWRLIPDNWILRENSCEGRWARIEILSNETALDLSLARGWESRYYLDRSPLPVLEAVVKGRKEAEVTTLIKLR